MEKILILDNYDSFTYNIVHYVEENSNFIVDVFRNDKISLAEVNKYDKIILSPGPGLPEEAGILKDIIKKYATSKKILGICLGMQAIGEVFGGELQNLNQVYHGVATPINIIEKKDVLYQNIPTDFKAGRYHSWVIKKESLPKELQLTATDKNNQIMSITHKKYAIYGVQYHPESILTENGKQIITNFLNI